MDDISKLLKKIEKQNAEIIENQNTIIKQNAKKIKELANISFILSEAHGVYPKVSDEI